MTNRFFSWSDFKKDKYVVRCENYKAACEFAEQAWTKGVRFYDYPNATSYIDNCYYDSESELSQPIYLYCGCFVTNQIEYDSCTSYSGCENRIVMSWYQRAVKVPVKQVFYVCPCVKEITILSDKNYDSIDIEIDDSLAIERVILEFI